MIEEALQEVSAQLDEEVTKQQTIIDTAETV